MVKCSGGGSRTLLEPARKIPLITPSSFLQDQVNDSDVESCHQYPDDIQEDGQAAIRVFARSDFAAKRRQSEHSHLEGLYSKRNADDGEKQN